MARITVEDCLENVTNRFELVLVASLRAKMLDSGAETSRVPWENDKATVVALREIAQKKYLYDEYLKDLAKSLGQR